MYYFLLYPGCQKPESIDFGEVTWNGTEVESSVATYTCNKGYNIAGPKTRTCKLYAEWDQRLPNCKSKIEHEVK